MAFRFIAGLRTFKYNLLVLGCMATDANTVCHGTGETGWGNIPKVIRMKMTIHPRRLAEGAAAPGLMDMLRNMYDALRAEDEE
jgi:hypothetical protein